MAENTELLAASGLFEAGNKLGLAVLGFLALAALVIGAGDDDNPDGRTEP